MTQAPAARFDSSVWLARLAGLSALLSVWILTSEVFLREHSSVPAPWVLAAKMVDDFSFYGPHIKQTMYEASLGYLWGNLMAFAVGIVFVFIPAIERIAFRLVVAVYCLPLIATAPILKIIFSGDQAKIAVAAQAVLFTTVVGVTIGLRSAHPVHLDLVRAAGGGSWAELTKVRLRSAIPGITSGLKIAAPAALLGAVIGEFLGGTRGLGVAMIASQQSFDVARTWGLAMVLTALSAIVYVGTGLIGDWLTPWRATTTDLGDIVTPTSRGSLWQRVLTTTAYFVGSVVLIIGLWALLIKIFDLNNFFAKTPLDVWRYVSGPEGPEVRQSMGADLLITLRNAGLGYAVGTIGALVLAIAVTSNKAIEQAVMPIAIGVRAVPLVAMTPLVALIFGRGLLCVLVIAGIVTFFPSLVQIVDGLRSTPEPALEAVSAFGGSSRHQLFAVRLPYALPSVFASARVAGPLAIIGATLAEWLATGKGIGNRMVLALAHSDFVDLWTVVVVITASAVAVYSLASMLESLVLRRFHGMS